MRGWMDTCEGLASHTRCQVLTVDRLVDTGMQVVAAMVVGLP